MRIELNLYVSHNRLSQVVPKLPYLGEHSEDSQAWSLCQAVQTTQTISRAQ